jgi:hypothetical protein
MNSFIQTYEIKESNYHQVAQCEILPFQRLAAEWKVMKIHVSSPNAEVLPRLEENGQPQMRNIQSVLTFSFKIHCLLHRNALLGFHIPFVPLRCHHSPPILYLNILSFILPPVFRQVCATVCERYQLQVPLPKLFIDSTCSIQPDSMQHGIDEQSLDRICSVWPLFSVEMSIDRSIRRDAVITLRPILRILSSWFWSRIYCCLRLFPG